MNDFLPALAMVLRHEREFFTAIYDIEERKTGAIMDRDGARLQELSNQQEDLLAHVAELEEERERLVKLCVPGAAQAKSLPSLREIVGDTPAAEGRAVLELGRETRELLVRLQGLYETNRRLIDDNLEFFNLFVSRLKTGTVLRTGYGSDGRQEGGFANPVLFNQTA